MERETFLWNGRKIPFHSQASVTFMEPLGEISITYSLSRQIYLQFGTKHSSDTSKVGKWYAGTKNIFRKGVTIQYDLHRGRHRGG